MYGECEEPEEPEEELSGSEHEAEDEQTDSGVSSSPLRTPGNEAEEGSESGSGKDADAISDDEVVPKDKPQPVNADLSKMEALPASLTAKISVARTSSSVRSWVSGQMRLVPC